MNLVAIRQVFLFVLWVLFSPVISSQIIRDDFLLNDDNYGGCRQEEPAIAINNTGYTIITWTDFRDGNADIYVQRMDVSGNLMGNNFRANTDAGLKWQGTPSVAIHSLGNFVVVWEDRRNCNSDVFCQRFNATGLPIDTNFQVNDNIGTSDQRNADVIIQPNQNIIVVWDDWRNDWGDIYGQIFDTNANPVGTNFRINTDGYGNTQYQPAIAQDSLGNFVVAWMDGRNGHWDIYAQRFNSQGTPLGNNFRVNDDQNIIIFNKQNPIPSDKNGPIFDKQKSVTNDRNNLIFNKLKPVSDDRNGLIFNKQKAVSNDRNNLIFDKPKPVSDDRNSLIFNKLKSVPNDRNSPIFNKQTSISDDITTTDQTQPRLACFRNGQFVIVWEDQRNGNSDIYLQRFDNNGNRIGTNLRVNDDNGNAVQMLPDITFDNNGNFIITWTDNRNGDFDIFCQRYNNLGLAIGPNFRVNDDNSNQDQSGSCIAVNSRNEFFIVWSDKREINSNIYYQKYNNLGNPLGINLRINDDFVSSHQRCSWICQSGIGNYIVTWEDERNVNTDIYAARLDSLGNIFGPNFKVNDDSTTQDQFYASVTANFTGDFIIAWTDGRNNNFDIYAQRYSSTGIPIANNFRVNDDNTHQTQWYPVVASDSLGNTIIVWIDYRNGNPDIYGQLYDYLGNPLGSNFIINESPSATQLYPFVARNAAGRFVVTWMDNRNGNFDIYCQRFDHIGNTLGANLKVNSDTTTTFQGYPAVTINSAGDFVIVWEDNRNQDTDIYLQRFNNLGTPIQSNIKVNDDISYEQYSPTVYYSENGKYVVTWCDARNSGEDLDIFSQAYADNGVPIGINRQINHSDLFRGNNQWLIGQGVVANSRRINFTWTDNRRHQGWDIYSKIVDWDFFAGISENTNTKQLLNKIKIFPNPTYGKIYINYNQPIISLKIFNSNGQRVKNIQINNTDFSKSTMLDLSDLKSGIYFIHYETQPNPTSDKDETNQDLYLLNQKPLRSRQKIILLSKEKK
ncbi:MAG: T9SS type A sorting domain-containing protein [candidate division WOR-3 bacterium]|nr:T9SS type A sorting domain-containing protein [candidate division WOR-3 bacterium]